MELQWLRTASGVASQRRVIMGDGVRGLKPVATLVGSLSGPRPFRSGREFLVAIRSAGQESRRLLFHCMVTAETAIAADQEAGQNGGGWPEGFPCLLTGAW